MFACKRRAVAAGEAGGRARCVLLLSIDLTGQPAHAAEVLQHKFAHNRTGQPTPGGPVGRKARDTLGFTVKGTQAVGWVESFLGFSEECRLGLLYEP